MLAKLLKAGVSPQKTKPTAKKLAGQTFVLTGSLENMSREEAKKLIRDAGGNISSSVSKKTDYVIVGKDPGSKYEKAQKLGVEIIAEAKLATMIK